MGNHSETVPITADDISVAIREWFERFGRYCASVDYESARRIFAPDVVSFGTKAEIVSGLNHLQKNQWEGIWPNIRDFTFDLHNIYSSGDGRYAWGITTWASTGFDREGKPFFRPGRATVVLERREGEWLAVHTHISLYPGTPPSTFGPKGVAKKQPSPPTKTPSS
ncbi:MAG: nuclear transport factor 2 family protein [Thaumarchaeota archaeon]|nr:nuclear transport factor 2 family protein [Nitrososphaerota archaeon]